MAPAESVRGGRFDFDALLSLLGDDGRARGRTFEKVCQWFLGNDPAYRLLIKQVWLWDEWPGRWGPDAGIDLVAETVDGDLWAIQAKAYGDSHYITKGDVDTFLSESSRAAFSYRLLIASTNLIGPTARRTLEAQEKPVGRLFLSDLRRANLDWSPCLGDLAPAAREPRPPLPHQSLAIADVIEGFRSSSRGQLIMPCGTGKTMVGLYVAEALHAQRVLVLVPSISLLAQTLREWCANAQVPFPFLPVCSDESVTADDDVALSLVDLGLPATTNFEQIAGFLDRHRRAVVFSTYQSSREVGRAAHLSGAQFDLVIADEAHRCAGSPTGPFAAVVEGNGALPAARRLFMTATPRIYRKGGGRGPAEIDVISMSDIEAFGPVFHRQAFGTAIRDGLLADYRVAIVAVDDEAVLDLIERRRFVSGEGLAARTADDLAAQIGLAKTISRFGLRRILTFHARVRSARLFAESFPDTVTWLPLDVRPRGSLWTDYVSGQMPSGMRDRVLDRLKDATVDACGLVANARCLGEGVDVPELDAVAFIDPKRSQVDVVQAVGRAIRRAGDKVGTIFIPVFLPKDADLDSYLLSTKSPFQTVWGVLRALRAHDERFAVELDDLRWSLGRQREGRLPPRLFLDLPAAIANDFESKFEIRLVEQTTSAWDFMFRLLKQFAEREGHCDVANDWQEDGHDLANWLKRQRSYFFQNKLREERVLLLSGLPGWTWNRYETKWHRAYDRLLRYVAEHGDSDVPYKYAEGGVRLGRWVQWQRAQRNYGRLSHDQIALLERVPGWVWNEDDARWDKGFAALRTFVAREHSCDMPPKHVEEGFPLGEWTRRQQRLYKAAKINSSRISRLEALPGWHWPKREPGRAKTNQARQAWQLGWESLAAFYAREGHAAVPVSHLEGDFALGSWTTYQRRRRRLGHLDEDQVAKLASLHKWSWEPHQDKWDSGYRHLLAFSIREGHLEIPRSHVEPDGYALAFWTREQRKLYHRGALAVERIAKLEAVRGWGWGVKRPRRSGGHRPPLAK